MLIDYCTVPSERYFCVPLLFSFVYCTVPSNCYLVFHLVFSCILYCSLVYCISLVLFLFFCVMKIKYIMYIMLKNTAFFIINLFAWLYGMFGILFTCGKHLHGHIISLIYEVSAHETSLNPLLFFLLKYLYQVRKVNGHAFVLDYGIVLTVWYVLYFILLFF